MLCRRPTSDQSFLWLLPPAGITLDLDGLIVVLIRPEFLKVNSEKLNFWETERRLLKYLNYLLIRNV